MLETPVRIGVHLRPILLVAAAVVAASPSIVFENIAEKSGVDFVLDNSVTPEKHQIETMISGVAVFDYNNDGLMDLYFVNGAKLPGMDKSDPRFWNRLYRNNGDGTWTDVTEKAGVKGEGYGMGVAAADFDNDGLVDLYVTGVNRNHLFHNNGDGTFSDITAKAGVAGIDPKFGKTWAISAGWFDYDNDGWLDLFVVNYVRWSPATEPACQTGGIRAYCSPDSYEGEPNMLFHNNHDGTFTDVSQSSGIGRVIGKGMGVVFADYDNDGWTDAFVSNDTFRNLVPRQFRSLLPRLATDYAQARPQCASDMFLPCGSNCCLSPPQPCVSEARPWDGTPGTVLPTLSTPKSSSSRPKRWHQTACRMPATICGHR